ncbi:hypothetical protein BJX76DRAFT_347540 [Aspergillus varians]
MDLDDISLDSHDQLKQKWIALASKSGTGVCKLANGYRKREDGMLYEKVRAEVALMEYTARETNIPVPQNMSDILKKPDAPGKHDVLNPDVAPGTLKKLYGEMTEVLLELWNLDFNRIGSLGKATTGERVYHTSVDHIRSLLELQSTLLEQQRNSVYDSKDCHEKHACRHVMKAIVSNFIPSEDQEPFKIFCDDFWPGTVLVDDSLHIVGILDWEFSYAALFQFASSIPWWRLLRVFLEALEEREEVRGLSQQDGRLSVRMRRSIENKDAWFTLACHMVSSGPRPCVADRVRTITTATSRRDRQPVWLCVGYYNDRGRNLQLRIQRQPHARCMN